ncbi:hypothetical protein B0I32_12711 [Nonomuraea fuscirosea]|jgi:hypothetical protein|uniref:Uncharacterized protein n=1 Tax=Nonomuraea fuscirosea TaxID=1291556 RepID=A0A2T0M7H2_9ACTN|nr:hypothetical protein B0I32_12711 [Nonomuraea fuscirosea]
MSEAGPSPAVRFAGVLGADARAPDPPATWRPARVPQLFPDGGSRIGMLPH